MLKVLLNAIAYTSIDKPRTNNFIKSLDIRIRMICCSLKKFENNQQNMYFLNMK
jgi:hypothetical protein